jgi:hypothetical protein
METLTKLFVRLLVFVYHGFDRIVIHAYLNGSSRPGQVVHFFRKVLGEHVVINETLSRPTADYQQSVGPCALPPVAVPLPDHAL